MEKYLVTIEFRYDDVPKHFEGSTYRNETITIGIFDDFDSASIEGNKALEVFESKFKLNPNYNKKERFSKNGGAFGNKKTLISNLGYLQTPFAFYAKIDTLKYSPVEETLNKVIESAKRYKQYKLKNDD